MSISESVDVSQTDLEAVIERASVLLTESTEMTQDERASALKFISKKAIQAALRLIPFDELTEALADLGQRDPGKIRARAESCRVRAIRLDEQAARIEARR